MAAGRARAARSVGRYELVHELSQSYLGPLWAARVEGDANAGLAMLRLVSLARLDADTRVRLLEAAWQAMEVRDDRVAAVTDVVASDGELGVVAEYVEGVALRALSSFASVRRKPAPPPVALRMTLDLLAAVASLHKTTAELGEEAVPLYGGLSADSVLVTTSGKTVVLDVAIASAAAPIETLGGNPERTAYAAPEQLASPPRADPRTDVFAVGVLAWELLSSRRLFVGADKAVAQKVLSSKIPRPDELKKRGDPEMPAGFVSAVMKALERDPAARFESIDAFTTALANGGVEPAAHDAVSEYVNAVAEGALSRAREALRASGSGTRLSVPAKPKTAPVADKPKPAPAAAPAAAKPAPVAAKPATPPLAAKPPAKPAMPMRAEAKPVMPARPETKPGIPARPEGKPAIPVRPEAKSSPSMVRPDPRPQIRARQPTMIGIPAPAILPSPDSGPVAPPKAPEATASPSAPDSVVPSSAIEVVPESAVDSLPLTTPTLGRDEADSLSGEEPTGQYSSRDLLKQVEAMGRPSKRPSDVPGVTPTPPPSDFPGASPTPPPSDFPMNPAPGDFLDLSPTPPPSDFPEPATAPRIDVAAPPVPKDAGWLDDPGSMPPPPPSSVDRDATTPDDPAEVVPAASAPIPSARVVPIAPQPILGAGTPMPVPGSPVPAPAAARPYAPVHTPTPFVSERPPAAVPSVAPRASMSVPPAGATPRPATSVPPPAASPAYLPSQIPPPLFHDPRARTATAPTPRKKGKREEKTELARGTMLGIALSLVLVVASAALAVAILRSREKTAPPADTAAAEPAPVKPEPAPAAAAPEAPSAAVPTPEEPSAAPAAEAKPTEAASAEAQPQTAETAAPAEPAKPAAAVPIPRSTPAARPAPAKKPAPKKKARYVPDDI